MDQGTATEKLAPLRAAIFTLLQKNRRFFKNCPGGRGLNVHGFEPRAIVIQG